MITPAIIRAVMPAAGRRADIYGLLLADAAARFDIGTPVRAAAYLAQVAHESGQLAYTREVWGPRQRSCGTRAGRILGIPRPATGSGSWGAG
ncbi:hypothetical protein [Cupriavidus malaysiensis]|uniref:hypothetical protein n=1 Tax=Cupriavidus malaysiensis TaxID=367825 RepID=UPI001F41A735|nr:hypothetical protein [Cupriavidus malaysiensis]